MVLAKWPQAVENKMGALRDLLSRNLPSLDSVYLYGSVALGDFIDGSSDIDFIAVLREPPSPSDIEAIKSVHIEVESAFSETDVMGTYLLRDDLGMPRDAIGQAVTYYEKQVHTDGYGADLNPVTWWIIKHHGMVAYGSPDDPGYEVEADRLVRYVLDNMNGYWLSWVERLEKELASAVGGGGREISAEQLDFAVEWCTLGMLRQLYTIRERDVVSKVRAGYYGIKAMPERWHGLIREAIAIKKLEPDRYYRSDVLRLEELVALLRYIHRAANETSTG